MSLDRQRLDELLADRVLWGLSDEEEREFAMRRRAAPAAFDVDSELFALEHAGAAITMALLTEADDVAEPPAAFRERAALLARDFLAGRSDAGPRLVATPPAARPRAAAGRFVAWSGWAAAAALLVVLALGVRTPPPLAPQAALDAFLAAHPDVVRMRWDSGPGGDVIWSPGAQAGFLLLSGLPHNDPGQFQYQLWIFDRQRASETPVDGGVFDLATAPAESPAIVPIDAKLRVHDAFAFAITKETPGGVVVSAKRADQIVAAAGL